MALEWLDGLQGRKPDATYKVADNKDAHSHTRSNFLLPYGDGVIATVAQGVVPRPGSSGHYGTKWEAVVLDRDLAPGARVDIPADAPIRAVISHIVDDELWLFCERGNGETSPFDWHRYRLVDGLEHVDSGETEFAVAALDLDFEGRRAVARGVGRIHIFDLTPDGVKTHGEIKYEAPAQDDRELFFDLRSVAIGGGVILVLGCALDDSDRSWAHLRFYTPGPDGFEAGDEKVIFNRSGFGLRWFEDDRVLFFDATLVGFDVSKRSKMKAAGTAKLWSKVGIYQVQRVEDEVVGFGTGNLLKRAAYVDGKIKKTGQVRLKSRVDGALLGDGVLWVYDAKKGVFSYRA